MDSIYVAITHPKTNQSGGGGGTDMSNIVLSYLLLYSSQWFSLHVPLTWAIIKLLTTAALQQMEIFSSNLGDTGFVLSGVDVTNSSKLCHVNKSFLSYHKAFLSSKDSLAELAASNILYWEQAMALYTVVNT